jgi:hypothetical protein
LGTFKNIFIIDYTHKVSKKSRDTHYVDFEKKLINKSQIFSCFHEKAVVQCKED